MISSSYKKIATLVTTLFLVCSFAFAPFSFSLNKDFYQPRHAEAIFGLGDVVIEVGANLANNIWTAARSFVQTVITNALYLKEYVLDLVGWGLVNIVLEQMLRSTINWVNSGFDGKPMFMTDVRGFMTDIADVIFDDFVTERNLQFLCGPFQADIFGALQISYLDYNRFYEPKCRISDVVDNLDAFVNGNFIGGGGWDAWHNVALVPSNNPYGAFAEARFTLNSRIASARQVKREELGQAGGFLSMKDCQTIGEEEICETVTPGTAINNQLNRSLNTGTERLTIADELDELLGALFTQLLSQAFASNSGGVRGFSSSRSGGQNYFEQYNTTTNPQPSQSKPPLINTKELSDTAYEEQVNISTQADAKATGYGYVSSTCYYESLEYKGDQDCRDEVYLDLSNDFIGILEDAEFEVASCDPRNSFAEEQQDVLLSDIRFEISKEIGNRNYIEDVIAGVTNDVFSVGEIENYIDRKADLVENFTQEYEDINCN